MQPQHIHSKIKKILSQEGNILILSLYIIILVLVLSFGMIEIGKVMVTKEKLQTAADAASLEAGSMEAYREVKIVVHTKRAGKWIPGDEDDPGYCLSCGTVTRGPFTGSEKKLLEQGQWKTRCARKCPSNCAEYRCWYEIKDRKMMYNGNNMSTEMSETQINTALTENAEYLRQDLIWAVDEKDEKILNAIFKNKPTPKDIKKLLENRTQFINDYLAKIDMKQNCNYNCSKTRIKYGDSSDEYKKCKADIDKCKGQQEKARAFYDMYQDKLLKIVNEQIELDQQLVDWNNQLIEPSNTLKKFLASRNSEFFNLNRPLEGNVNQGNSYANWAEITSAKAYDYDRNATVQSPYYPSVVVVATAKISNWFYNESNNLLSVGPKEWVIKVCSQSSTSYRDASELAGQEYDNPSQHKGIGSWLRVPKDACKYWEENGVLP